MIGTPKARAQQSGKNRLNEMYLQQKGTELEWIAYNLTALFSLFMI